MKFKVVQVLVAIMVMIALLLSMLTFLTNDVQATDDVTTINPSITRNVCLMPTPTTVYSEASFCYNYYDSFYTSQMFLKFSISNLTLTGLKSCFFECTTSTLGYWGIWLVTSSWDDSVTWATKPSYDSDPYHQLYVDQATEPLSINMTNFLKGWLNGSQANYGIMLSCDQPTDIAATVSETHLRTVGGGGL